MGVITYPFTYPSLYALDGGWADSWKQDSPAYLRNPQINEVVGSLLF